MQRLYTPWDTPRQSVRQSGRHRVPAGAGARRGAHVPGHRIWGPGIEGNPLLSSAIAYAGTATSLAAAKSIAIGFGMVLHLYRVHTLVAVLTLFYVAAAIIPWTALLLTN